MSELLPCPFCGGTDIAITDATRVLGVFRLIHRCQVMGPLQTERAKTEAVAAVWNTRALPAVQPDAQCCMCGKKGLSTKEDGGPECELSDGRWVCSSACWDRVVQPDREAALREAAEMLDKRHRGDLPAHIMSESGNWVRALIDTPTGKEVMPDATRKVCDHDTAPAGLSAGGGAEWQPIETAPQDGTPFLAYWVDFSDPRHEKNGCEITTRRNFYPTNRDPGAYTGGFEHEVQSNTYGVLSDWENQFIAASDDWQPTHWMPRPAKPATKGGAEPTDAHLVTGPKCECGMTGPCMWTECKAPILRSQKGQQP